MADNFGLKIGIEGEKDFKNALRDINTSFKVLGSEMNLVSSEFDKNDRSMESFTSRNRVLNKEIENQTQKIETLQKALNNASESFGENDKRTLAWQVQLNNAKADLNKLNAEVKDNHSAMEKAQNPTEDLAQDVKAFGKNADTAGSQTLKMGDIIKANLISEAIISGIKSLGSAMVDITRKFVEFAKEGVENASNLAESQNVVDVTFKDSASAINDWSKKAASAYGLSELEAKKYNGTIGALLSSSGVASDKLTGMSTNLVGLAADFSSFYNLDHDMAFDKIRAGISGETEPLKQLGINMSVANLQAYAMAQGIEKTYTNMTQAEQATLRYNYLLKVSADAQGDFARTSDGFANQQRIAQLNIENIATSIGSKLLPVLNTGLHTLNGMFDGSVSLSDGLKDMTDMILELVGDITERIPEFAKIGGEIITALLSTIINALPALIEGAKELLAALATGIMDNLPLIIEMGLGIIFDLAESIIAALPLIVQAGIDLIVKLALGIAEALPELIPKIVDAVILIVETLIDNIDMLVDASIAIIMALAEGLITALPILIEKLPIIIDKLIVAITDNLPKLLEMGIILILKLAEGLMKAIPQLIEKIPMIIASLISGFASLYSKLANVGIDLITKVRDGFVSKVLEFKDIGINMVKGLWEGIKNSTTWLLDKIKGFGADVMNGIKDFFGIHSPSSLMEAEVGKNLGLGVASGITKSGLTIKDAFKNVIPTDLDATLSYNANFLNPPERTNSIIDYSSLKRVFVEALKEMNLSVALDGYKVGEIIKNTVIKEVFA